MMKFRKQIVTALSLLLLTATGCVPSSSNGNEYQGNDSLLLTSIQWKDTLLQLGDIHSGVSYQLSFPFRNTGNNQLLLLRVESTCGCTLIDDSCRKPVAAGQEGAIAAQFKLTEPVGFVERKIYVITNTAKEFQVLRIKANVKE